MHVKTNHQVVAFGNDLMGLFTTDGTKVVEAARAEGGWLITADGAEDQTVADRQAAIDALIETALAVLPGTGYSCLVPRGLAELP